MKQNLNTKTMRIEDNSVVIKKHIKDIEGGRTLDVTDFPLEVIQAGHVVITNGSGTYKPMPVAKATESATEYTKYGALPSGFTYAGVVYSGVLTEKPAVSIMTWGVVNEAALPFAVTDIKSAFVTACPHIDFSKDEEA